MTTTGFPSPDFGTRPAARATSGETFAVGCKLLTDAQQRALILCLDAPLELRGRQGWRHPRETQTRFAEATMRALSDRGLISLARAGMRRGIARLTPNGAWYARSLVSLHGAGGVS